MKFLSVCSGIEAASVAWQPLGWKAVAFSEIEPFPCAVLAHHYPDTPNWGDMNKYKDWPDVSIDLLCGGTPCQSFSVAGLRKGLDDPRGNLMLTFGAIAAKYRPKWLVWENVPGVLNSENGRDFASFLGLLTGQQITAPDGRWGNSGVIAGINSAYGVAWRVLDAQYFGVAQRRRRVFVVGCLGGWRSAAAVLFERHSLQGHPAPSRQARQTTTRGVEFGPSGGRFTDVNPTLDTRAKDGPVRNQLARCVAVAGTMKACKDSGDWSNSADHAAAGYMIPVSTLCAATGQAGAEIGAEIGADMAPTLNCNHEAPCVVGALACNTGSNGHDAGNFACNQAVDAGHVLAVTPFDTTQITSAANYSNPKAGDPCHPLAAQAHVPSVAYTTKLHNTTSNNAGKIFEERTVALDANSPPPALLTAMQVRRLTPVECARLQGFPDDYLDITVRGKPAADGPKYKALGNSWAAPNVRWIAERIQSANKLNSGVAASNRNKGQVLSAVKERGRMNE